MTYKKEEGEVKKSRTHLSIRPRVCLRHKTNHNTNDVLDIPSPDTLSLENSVNGDYNNHIDSNKHFVENGALREIENTNIASRNTANINTRNRLNRSKLESNLTSSNATHSPSLNSRITTTEKDNSSEKKNSSIDINENLELGNAQENTEAVTIYLQSIRNKSHEELLRMAESLEIENPENFHKNELVYSILQKITDNGGTLIGEGTLDILQDGYGFLRSSRASYMSAPDDIYVSHNQIRKNGLRTGDTIVGLVRGPKKGERYFALQNIQTVNGLELSNNRHRPHFDDLTPMFPDRIIKLETTSTNLSSRILDIAAPLGMGQRALIVAPPRTGKTVLMQNIAHAITDNYPEISLIVLLIDERPEEVTDMSRSVKGEVVSSTFDEPSHRHVQLAEMVIEKAKRLVEAKKDVVILLDSITRLARAYNNISPSSGKVLSGGVDSNALQRPKRFFGAARNIEEGGSLTIIATALVETGSRMDEVIFEEFKGTGNLEIILDRKIAERRIFPSIDVSKSGTRKEDLLVDKATLAKIWILRRILSPMSNIDGIEFLIDKLKFAKTNEIFFEKMDTGPNKKNNI